MKSGKVLLLFHVGILVLLLSTLGNAWVPPNFFGKLNLLSLFFPYLVILHIIFTIVWIIKRKKIAFVFVLSTLIFYNPIKRWIKFSPQNEENNITNCDIKVLTFNVQYGSFGWKNVKKYIVDQDADIILVQEKDTNRVVKKNLVKYPTVILKTKHRIIRQAQLLCDNSKGNSFYADIEINGKVIRVVNVYLEPFRLNKSMFEFDGVKEEKSKFNVVFSHLIPTFRTHEDQIRKIRKAIDNSPYPVILAGDFNSVPNSYEYYNLGKNLDDAFVKAGNGTSTSFHDYGLPLRIDYIFTSKSIVPVSYKVDYSVKLSDHYPVIAEFQLN